MGVNIDIDYQGNLRCVAVHGPSQDKVPTDAPVDNMGQGKHFSPTDLLATALGTCMITTMGIVARKQNVELPKMQASVIKEMGSNPKRHVAKLVVQVTMPASLTADQRAFFENVAHTCPVAVSLSPSTQIDTTFKYV